MSHASAPFLTLGFCHWLGIHRNAHLITIYGYPDTGFMQIIQNPSTYTSELTNASRLLVVFAISLGYLVITLFFFYIVLCR